MTLQVEIKCNCGTRNETPGVGPTLAFYNDCKDCGVKNELRYVGTPSLGGTK